jgi:acetoin utilization deacetylase AcuC-like enzyme
MNRTGIVRDPRYLNHFMEPGHPESPERLKALYQMLDEDAMKGRFDVIPPRPATRQEIELFHDPGYIDLVASTAGLPVYRLDMDTSTSAQSYETALLAAGGLIELIGASLDGKVRNGFAMIRPPGHHAERDRAMGFCLFNNIAVGARFAVETRGLDRVLVVDWDVHHGNGTQNAFYEDPRVLYFSIHRYGFFYPGTGGAAEVGRGDGAGFNVNVPLMGRGGDVEYETLFETILRPIALQYKPQLILVSAGFDIHYNDPLGGMEVTEGGFAELVRILMEIAAATAEERLIFSLEGGYSVSGQRDSVREVLKELAGFATPREKPPQGKGKPSLARIEKTLLQVREIQSRYWKDL